MPDGNGQAQTFEYVPDALYWWRWTKRYGLPYTGGWLDQPQMFMKEIDAARRGYERRERERVGSTDELLKVIVELLERN